MQGQEAVVLGCGGVGAVGFMGGECLVTAGDEVMVWKY